MIIRKEAEEMIKFNEDDKFFRNDNPNGSIAMPLVRRTFPQLFASQTVGVVPTTEPQRIIICT